MSALVTDPKAFNNVICSGDTDSIVAVLQALKSYAKRNPIDLSHARSYFISLQTVLQSQIPLLNSLAHSCCGHLIKRIISQNSDALVDLLDAAIPSIIHGLSDLKPAIRASCAAVLNDVFAVCSDKLDPIFRDLALQSEDRTIVLGALDILQYRITTTPSLSFKIFTPVVVSLLQKPDTEPTARSVLIEFFKSAKQVAKNDLANEFARQSIDQATASSILSSIGFLNSKSPKPVQKSGIALNIDFFLKDERYELEPLPSEDCSLDKFRRDVLAMLPSFEGKETEFNWQLRESHITRLRSLLRGDIPREFPDQFCQAFKQLADGIIKAASSLRTVLSTASCLLIKEAFLLLGTALDPVAEVFLVATVKFSALTKRITSSSGMLAASAILLKSSFSLKAIHQIASSLNDKNPQPRLFAARMIRIILYAHQNIKNVIDSSGGREIIEKCITKALPDANTGVREEMRKAFWAYHQLWPNNAQRILNSLDNAVRRAVERASPGEPMINTTGNKGSSSLREFIMASREKNVSNASRLGKREPSREPREPKIMAPPAQNHVLTSTLGSSQSGHGFKGNLGPPQSNTIRTTSASGSIKSGPIRSVPMKQKPQQPGYLNPTFSVTASAVNSSNPSTANPLFKGPPIPGASTTNEFAKSGRKTPQNVNSLGSQQKILEKLSSIHHEDTESGVRSLVESILKNSMVPTESLAKPLHRLFQKQRKDPSFHKSVRMLSQYPQVVSYILKAVSPTEFAIAVITAWPSTSSKYEKLGEGDDSDDGMTKEGNGVGVKVIEQLIAEVEPDRRLSLATYIISYRHDRLKKQAKQEQQADSSNEPKKVSLEDDIYTHCVLDTVLRKYEGIVLDSEKVDDIKLISMYLRSSGKDKRVMKLFSEIKDKLGYIRPKKNDDRRKEPQLKKDSPHLFGSREASLELESQKASRETSTQSTTEKESTPFSQPESKPEQPQNSISRDNTPVIESVSKGEPEIFDDNVPSESKKCDDPNETVLVRVSVSPEEVSLGLESSKGEDSLRSLHEGSHQSFENITDDVNDINMADAIDPNTFHKDSQDADTEETKSHNGSFVADSQEVLPDSDVVFSARTTTINSISGAELNVPKVTTLDPTFGDIYTSNEWASFESKVREIERGIHQLSTNSDSSYIQETSPTASASTSMESSFVEEKDSTKISHFENTLKKDDTVEVKNSADQLFLKLKEDHHIHQQKNGHYREDEHQKLHDMVPQLLDYLNKSDKCEISTSGKRSLLLLLEHLVSHHRMLFDGLEEQVVRGIMKLQSVAKDDVSDLDKQKDGSQGLERSVLTSGSFDVVKGLITREVASWEVVLASVIKITTELSKSVPSYAGPEGKDKENEDPKKVDEKEDYSIEQLWFAYEAVAVISKQGYITCSSSEVSRQDLEVILKAFDKNFRNLSSILSDGFTIHKTLIRRCCYVILIQLLGIFQLDFSKGSIAKERDEDVEDAEMLDSDSVEKSLEDLQASESDEGKDLERLLQNSKKLLQEEIIQNLDQPQRNLLKFLVEHPEAL